VAACGSQIFYCCHGSLHTFQCCVAQSSEPQNSSQSCGAAGGEALFHWPRKIPRLGWILRLQRKAGILMAKLIRTAPMLLAPLGPSI